MPLPNSKDWKTLTLAVRRNLQPALLNGLTAIEPDLDLYAQAFSEMAKRNVAADVYAKAVELRDLWPKVGQGEPPGALLELIKRAREAAEATGGTTKRRYDTVVCVGYKIKLAEWAQSSGVWVVNYEGDVDDESDMLTRCGKMQTAIQEAFKAYETKFPKPKVPGLSPPDRTLRIFMAPEFYFRGLSGAYSSDVAFKILPLLRKETNQSQYGNWLFVLGTVIMATFIEETTCPSCKAPLKKDMVTKTENFTRTIDRFSCSVTKCKRCNVPGTPTKIGAMIDNLALIQKGGEKGYENSFTVSKEWVSHIDFKREVVPAKLVPTANGPALPDWDVLQNRGINVMGKKTSALPPEGSRDLSPLPVGSKFLDERMGGSVFEIDGIRFGLEICLDHAKNRLTGKEKVSIQLVPSCGMRFMKYKCIAGGLYFGVDAGGKPECQVGINPRPPINLKKPIPCSVGGDIVVSEPLPIA